MAYTSITLPTNVWLGTLTNLIAKSYAVSRHDTAEMKGVLSRYRGANITNGIGYINRATTLPEVRDLSTANSTLLTERKPTVKEEVFKVDAYKYIQLTINDYLLPGAFASDTAMGTFIALVDKSMKDAKDVYLYKLIIKDIDDYLKNMPQGNQFSVTTIATSTGETMQEKQAIRTYNATQVIKKIIETIKSMGVGLISSLDADLDNPIVNSGSLTVFLTPSLMTQLDINMFATLYNAEAISKEVKINFETYFPALLTNPGMTDKKILIVEDSAIKYGFAYETATSFFDPSTLNKNKWLHFSYYHGVSNFGAGAVINLAQNVE